MDTKMPPAVERLVRLMILLPEHKHPLWNSLADDSANTSEVHDVDHDRHGRGLDQLSDTKETSVHSDHDRARQPNQPRSLVRDDQKPQS